eukprot:scaffold109721_cov42-Prasinocladus_malaysianus.AAC.1
MSKIGQKAARGKIFQIKATAYCNLRNDASSKPFQVFNNMQTELAVAHHVLRATRRKLIRAVALQLHHRTYKN